MIFMINGEEYHKDLELDGEKIAKFISRQLFGSKELEVHPDTIRKLYSDTNNYSVVYSGDNKHDFKIFKTLSKKFLGMVNFYHSFDSRMRSMLKNNKITIMRDIMGKKHSYEYEEGQLNDQDLIYFLF